MKLTLFFVVIDLLVLLAYPVVYVLHHMRKLMGTKK